MCGFFCTSNELIISSIVGLPFLVFKTSSANLSNVLLLLSFILGRVKVSYPAFIILGTSSCNFFACFFFYHVTFLFSK